MKKGLEPAFPTDVERQGMNGGIIYGKACGGITIRDYFAAKAMQGLISMKGGTICTRHESETPAETIVNSAYRFADAMLAEREKDGER